MARLLSVQCLQLLGKTQYQCLVTPSPGMASMAFLDLLVSQNVDSLLHPREQQAGLSTVR